MPRVFIQSFGCRASQADGAAIEASLEEHGWSAVNTPQHAELVVLNTCTVTHSADIDARRLVRGLHRDHPTAKILVTGCYAQRAPQELSGLDGVRWVVGNSHKHTSLRSSLAARSITASFIAAIFPPRRTSSPHPFTIFAQPAPAPSSKCRMAAVIAARSVSFLPCAAAAAAPRWQVSSSRSAISRSTTPK